MTTAELLKFMERKSWSDSDRQVLIHEWNTRRTDAKPIGKNSVRTSCRLRQVVGSFKIFLSQEKAVI